MNENDNRAFLPGIMPQAVDTPSVAYQGPGDVEDHASGREDSKGHQSLYIVLGQQSHGEHRRCRDHIAPGGVLCRLGVADQRVVYQVECGPYHNVEHGEVVDEKEGSVSARRRERHEGVVRVGAEEADHRGDGRGGKGPGGVWPWPSLSPRICQVEYREEVGPYVACREVSNNAR